MDDLRSMAYRREIDRLHAEIARLRQALAGCVEHFERFLDREPADAHFDSYDVDRDMAERATAAARVVLGQGMLAGK